MTGGWVVTERLGSSRTTPHRVRAILTATLDDWGLADVADLADVAELLASELVTNALVHGKLPARFWMYVLDGRLYLEVSDSEPELPAPRDADAEDEGGRGLAIIEGLASEWGAEAYGPGKRVWLALGIDGAVPGSEVPVPREHAADPPTVTLQRIAA